MTGNTFYFGWEIGLLEWLQAHLSGGLLSFVSFLSMFGEELLAILILGFIYWAWDKEMGKRVGLNVLAASVLNPMAKNIALRRRPYFDHESITIRRVVNPDADIYDVSAQGWSFPSGHSTTSAALFGSVAVETKKALFWVLSILLPLLVGFSRMAVGAHYPTDVLFGWLLSVGVIAGVTALRRVIRSEVTLRLIILAVGAVGLIYYRSEHYFSAFGLLLGFVLGGIVEERYVKFDNTRCPIRMVLRVLGGVAVFFVLNTLLKKPFSDEFLDGGTYAALIVRCARYAVISLIDFAVYPILFRYTARIGAKTC